MSKTLFTAILLGSIIFTATGCGGAQTAAPPAPATAIAQATSVPSTREPTTAPAPTQAMPTNTPASTATSSASSAPSGLPYDVLTNAMKAQFGTKSFRATVKVTTAAGKVSTIMQEYVAPDRFHMVVDQMELIGIGSDTWMKTGGSWSLAPSSFGEIVKSFHDPAKLSELLKSISVDAVQFVGPDGVGGTPTWVYQYNTTVHLGGTNGDIKGTNKIWIGIVDGLPYKQEGETDSVLTKGGKDHTSGSYDYNAIITIMPPL